MNQSVSLLPPGRTFVRALIARATVGFDPENLMGFARTRWGEQHAAAVTKAAVSALGTGNADPDAREFFGLVREQSVLGRLVGLRRVPFNVRTLSVQTGARGFWVSQAKPKPLSKPALTGSSLPPLKVAAILVVTQEMLRSHDPAVESMLQDDLTRALTVVLDEALIDPDNAGLANETPASIAYGATQIAATSDFGADLRTMIGAFKGDLGYAAFVTSPEVATGIAMMTDSGGRYLFPNVGPRGGELIGLPLLTTRADATTTSGSSLMLLDPTGIAAALGALSIESSDAATLQMSDDPNDAGVPVEQVSLWQTNSAAFKAEIYANWSRQRAGSVIVLEGL